MVSLKVVLSDFKNTHELILVFHNIVRLNLMITENIAAVIHLVGKLLRVLEQKDVFE